jgi:hypothetical protein
MLEVFKGWRRKAGCIVLILASFALSLGYIQCEREAHRRIQCMNNLSWPPRPIRSHDDIRREVYAKFSYLPSVAIALPLALLAAYLILSNPRPKADQPPNQKNNSN